MGSDNLLDKKPKPINLGENSANPPLYKEVSRPSFKHTNTRSFLLKVDSSFVRIKRQELLVLRDQEGAEILGFLKKKNSAKLSSTIEEIRVC